MIHRVMLPRPTRPVLKHPTRLVLKHPTRLLLKHPTRPVLRRPTRPVLRRPMHLVATGSSLERSRWQTHRPCPRMPRRSPEPFNPGERRAFEDRRGEMRS